MPPRKYKRYLEPDSTEDIPRQTLHSKRKREKISPNREEISHSLSTIDASELQRLTISNQLEQNVSFEEMRIDADVQNSDLQFQDNANDIGKCEQNLHSSPEQHHNEPFDDDVNLFDEDASFQENPTSEEDGNDEEEQHHNEPFDDDADLFNEDVLFQENSTSEEDGNDEEILANQYDQFLSETLCPCSATTKGEALIMAILIGQKHCLTWVAILDIINMINKLYSNDVLPSSKYSLFKHFPLVEDTIKVHLFCPSCQRYLGGRPNLCSANVVCHACERDIDAISSFFITLNFTYQLQILLNNPDISKHLDHRFSRRKENDNAFEDIYDGYVYKKYSAPGNQLDFRWNLSYTFNTDGCQAAKSSKTSIWPVYVMLHELPSEIRSKHMFLIGLWVHKKEPNMNTFLQPFVNEANSLARDGVQWNLNNEIITSKVYPISCCVDSVARPCILNMIRFNGFYGCNFCEHPTEGVDGYRRYTMSTCVPPNRTDTSIRCRMQNALNNEILPVMNMGIKGPSVLINLEGFNLVDGIVPDYMHSVLLGVTRQYTEMILTSRGEEYYVGSPNQLAIINQRLTSIRPPTCITRLPRTLEERKCWKASEWRSWLLWYMLICLRGLFPMKYLRHVALLITAIHILLQKSVTIENINRAHQLLIKFLVKLQKYFGKSSMTFNMHLLLHLSTSVKNWGPLWTHNTFPFENENRLVLQMKTSPYLIAVQIARRYFFYKQLPMHLKKFPNGNRFIDFCTHYFQNRLKYVCKIDDCVLLGSGKDYTLTLEEQNCFGSAISCKVFHKMLCHGLRFTSEIYTRANKSNDSIIVTRDDTKGIITNICSYEITENDRVVRKIVVFFRKINISCQPYLATNDVIVTHIIECFITGGLLEKCSPAFIQGHCIMMTLNGKHYISDIPRGCLGD
ncbi:uncharacterized protein LOC120357652 [Solenopsis invicta]|uniref:uncharacterized protein LOC120357652 n=1 Tax=Solenopsis invicta TaxID=13686 RepID=UPI00193D4328|nr:uncharacterized protein LOC120357652 [Solenopsis invicta]XP_039304630.1 uncharacterized protein LOC120357652 [Solenopsis invicta]